MHFLQAINSDLSVLIVCNKTGGTIKGDIKKICEIGAKIISKISEYPLSQITATSKQNKVKM